MITVHELTMKLEELNVYIDSHPVVVLPEGEENPLSITGVRIVDDFIVIETEAC